MDQRQKEILQLQLDNEKRVIKALKQVYAQALTDCEKKICELSGRKDMENLQSIIYQRRYQEAIKAQLEGILEQLRSNEYSTISDYLSGCYEDGYIGVMYDLHGQGIPLVVPIDQKQTVQAVQTDSKISTGLYTRLGEDVKRLKTSIRAELSRGIANGSTWNEIAGKLARGMKNTPFNRAYNNAVRIARTEGHRIQIEAADHAQHEAKEKGADVVKQWDATLDGKTRDSHRMVDGEIRELDEKFSNGLMYPGDSSGGAAEVVNCRCALLQRAKWNLGKEELNTLKKRAEYFGLDKTKNFEEYKEKYLKAVENVGKTGTIDLNLQYFAKLPEEKFINYSLNPLKAPDKAKTFEVALGYNQENYKDLIENIKKNIDESRFVEKGNKGHGMLYEYVVELTGVNGKKANVLTSWIDENGDKRLTSVYVTKKKVTE